MKGVNLQDNEHYTKIKMHEGGDIIMYQTQAAGAVAAQ